MPKGQDLFARFCSLMQRELAGKALEALVVAQMEVILNSRPSLSR